MAKKYPKGTIGELKIVFDRHKDKSGWKKPIDTITLSKKETDLLVKAIEWFHAEKANVSSITIPVCHKEGLVCMEGKAYRIKSRGYQA